MPSPRLIRKTASALALACLLPLAACGGEDDARPDDATVDQAERDDAPFDDAPLEDPGPEVQGGNAGVDVTVSEDVSLQDVEIAYPEDGVYERGEDAPLYVGITNTANEPVYLTDVSGPRFAGVEVSDGELPLLVEEQDSLYVGAEGAPTIVLQDVEAALRSSESVAVTFTFSDGGEATVAAVVAASGQEPDSDVDFEDPDQDPSDG
jgi:copper(I)-binding protein